MVLAALALPAEAKAGVDDPREMERLAKGVEDVAHRRWLVSNDPDEHLEQLTRPRLDGAAGPAAQREATARPSR